MFPATAERVSRNTADAVNECIRRRTEANVLRCAVAGPEAIEHRLRELDREWDIERCVETTRPHEVRVQRVRRPVGRDRERRRAQRLTRDLAAEEVGPVVV